MSGIFGGSKSQSSARSENLNRGLINETYSGMARQGVDATDQVMRLLGGDRSGLQAFQDATGFDAIAERGSRGITGNAAARGLLRSGSTAMGLQRYGQELQDMSANQYLERLLGVGQLGLGAGGVLEGAGRFSTETRSERSKPGMGGFLGGIGSAIIAKSDIRAKKDIYEIGKNKDGLTVYQFRYLDDSGPFIGVMAQEVAEVKPEALGPTVDGYMTVDYSKIEGVI